MRPSRNPRRNPPTPEKTETPATTKERARAALHELAQKVAKRSTHRQLDACAAENEIGWGERLTKHEKAIVLLDHGLRAESILSTEV